MWRVRLQCIHRGCNVQANKKIPLFSAINRSTSSDATCGWVSKVASPVDLKKYTNSQLGRICGDGRDHIRTKLNVVSLGILGTGGNELSPSFFVKCDTRIYLFNIVEGWVRMTVSHRYPMSKGPVSFFTRASWENVSGSAAQYVASSSELRGDRESQKSTRDKATQYAAHGMVNPIQLYYGPDKVDKYMNYIKLFSGQGTWEKAELHAQPNVYKDENMIVSTVKLNPTQDSAGMNSVMAYSCKLADMSGTFLPAKAMELGVRHGPAYNLLLQGISVLTERGDLVKPSDVITGSRKGPSFLVVDCPTENYIDSIVSNQQFQPEWFHETKQDLKLIVHLTPHHLLQQESYSKWMSKFGNDTDHLLLHGSLCPGEVGFQQSHTFALPFHLMNPNVYHFPSIPERNIIDKNSLTISKSLKENSIIIGRLNMRYHLKPSKGVDTTSCIIPIQDRIKSDLNILKRSKILTERIVHHRSLLSITESMDDSDILSSFTRERPLPLLQDNDAMVTFLGTSASTSTKTRNVSGILIQTEKAGNILLDCGEGTVQQIYSCFGTNTAKDILSKIKFIFISHLHIDHHFGVIRLLKEVRRHSENPIQIISEVNYRKVLEHYNRNCEEIQFGSINAFNLMDSSFKCEGDVAIGTVRARHIQNSFGAVLRGGEKWSIVYSGDTVPSRRIVEAIYSPTLLIHEGTFEDDLKDEAVEKRHSTYSDAVRVGKYMDAKFTIVTHFSARRDWYPLQNKYWEAGVTPAVDFMSVRMSDLNQQKLDSPSCRDVFNSILKYEALYEPCY